jgi:hypothetical protein
MVIFNLLEANGDTCIKLLFLCSVFYTIVCVNTINYIIAFKYKIRLNFWWNMETGNYLQTYCNLFVYYDRGILFLDFRYSIESSYNYNYPYNVLCEYICDKSSIYQNACWSYHYWRLTTSSIFLLILRVRMI